MKGDEEKAADQRNWLWLSWEEEGYHISQTSKQRNCKVARHHKCRRQGREQGPLTSHFPPAQKPELTNAAIFIDKVS